MEEADYVDIYNWAYALASKILEEEDGERLLKNLYYAVRGEETPGRFYDSLAKELGDLKFAFDLEVFGKKGLFSHIRGDSFHLVRAAIILAMVNAYAGRGSGEGHE